MSDESQLNSPQVDEPLEYLSPGLAEFPGSMVVKVGLSYSLYNRAQTRLEPESALVHYESLDHCTPDSFKNMFLEDYHSYIAQNECPYHP
ncbi:hypothetical protein GEMRC1_009241 [Eukaryota sp. GEM-RC1]